MSELKFWSDFNRPYCGKTESYSPEHGVSTRTWKSPVQLKEWFCTMDLNLKKMKLMKQTHFIIYDTAMCYIFVSTAFYTLKYK